jgi:predicted lipoprotein with Yx(FWY)xxD motif
MTERSSPSTIGRQAVRATACLGAGALAAASLLLAGSGLAGAAAPLLKSANVPGYAGALENSKSFTLYLLSNEKGAKLRCTGSCLATWLPLDVKSTVTKISVPKNVKGKIGFVKRTATTKQVTFNTYPVYTYTGDTGPNQSMGQDVTSNGGIWHLVHAAAKSAGATSYLPMLNTTNVSTNYAGVLANAGGRTLYVLSAEKGGTLHCTGACLSTWPPLLVGSTATPAAVSLGNGVKGTIGFVARGSMKQVTFNTYPVYTYTGDTGPSQSCGENVSADGGTWTLTSAGATSVTGTPVAPVGTGGCGSGYGY